eukprot:scaffold1495_cov248-Pinguiococcus_pyrenoidosus.AAC.11
MYYRGAAAALLVYDITNEESFEKLKKWVSELENNGPPGESRKCGSPVAELQDDALRGFGHRHCAGDRWEQGGSCGASDGGDRDCRGLCGVHRGNLSRDQCQDRLECHRDLLGPRQVRGTLSHENASIGGYLWTSVCVVGTLANPACTPNR